MKCCGLASFAVGLLCTRVFIVDRCVEAWILDEDCVADVL